LFILHAFNGVYLNWFDNSPVTGTIMNGNLWYCSNL